jgi:hypothetical protein
MPSTPLFTPREFFVRRSPSLASAAIILLCTGVVAVASAAPYVDRVEPSTGMLVFSIHLGGVIGAVTSWAQSTTVV